MAAPLTVEIVDAIMQRLTDEGFCLVKAAEYEDLKRRIAGLEAVINGVSTYLLTYDHDQMSDVFKAILQPGQPLPASLQSEGLGMK